MTAAVTRSRAAAVAGCLGFLLLGWAGLLIPSLVRSIEHDFGQTDAGMGLFYFVNAVAYGTGVLGGTLLTQRLGRRPILAGGVGPGRRRPAHPRHGGSWPIFLARRDSVRRGLRDARRSRQRAHPRPVPGSARPGSQPAPLLLQRRRPGLSRDRRPDGRGRRSVAGPADRDRARRGPDRAGCSRGPRCRRAATCRAPARPRERAGCSSIASCSSSGSRSRATSRPRSASRTGSSASSRPPRSRSRRPRSPCTGPA